MPRPFREMLSRKLLKEVRAKIFNSGIARTVFVVFLFCYLGSVFWATLGLNDFHALKSDLTSFLTGASIVKEGLGKDLYDVEVQRIYQDKINAPYIKSNILIYKNPPPLALFFVPLSFFSIFTAYKIYNLVLILVTLSISWISTKIFKNLQGSFWYMLPFIFYPSFATIFSGQTSIFLLFGFMMIYFYLKKSNDIGTGITTGFLFLKPQYIISLPFIFLLTKNKRDFLRGFVLSSLIIFLLSYLIAGNYLGDYLRILYDTESIKYGSNEEAMFTLYSSLTQLTGLSKINLFLVNIPFYLLAVWFYYNNYRKLNLGVNFLVLVLLTCVFCLHGVNNDLALLLIPLWILIDLYKSRIKLYPESIFVIFILILSPLVYVLEISYLIPFLFLFSVALLSWKSGLQITEK